MIPDGRKKGGWLKASWQIRWPIEKQGKEGTNILDVRGQARPKRRKRARGGGREEKIE